MLYTIATSPFHCDFTAILRLIMPDSAVLLIQDGVIAAVHQSTHLSQLQQVGAQVYALEADVNARGLQNMISKDVILASYQDFVQLTVVHKQHFAL
ncbi:sulfurtransferase complex subunit TusB [Providencia burhodogranariea]|uniref:tRNA 2-thiouridine synthesizing protein B n=1 Tax=Providencia burhodogranariea DSM 19968 TaxID=1141662 RepID=K8WBG4_9GAMM|nr:sulfurtransferase complex subunit TusB [Providencia burhodogranariea]EKT57256.1 tRNA 2-thiouridine synthesizing protein B [Providencia burhodogranariea DSM 19968]